MENQKNNSSKSSGFSNLNFSIGLFISMFLIVCAFEWRTYVPPIEVPVPASNPINFSAIKLIEIHEPKVEVPIPKPIEKKSIEEIKVVEDKIKIEDIIKVPIIDEPIEPVLTGMEPIDEVVEVAPFVSFAEEMAEFDYKNQTFQKYIASKFRFPSKANGITGTIYIQFIVDVDGTLTDIEVLKGLNSELDQEAMRVFKNSPKWIPARQGGKAVRLRMVSPIRVGYQAAH